MSNLQKLELEVLGFKVVLLADIRPAMQEYLCNLQLEDDREALAQDLVQVAMQIGTVGSPATLIQPAGDPAFQYQLGKVDTNTQVWYAYSKRISEDIPQSDGSVKKISTFVHAGWVN